MFSVTFDKAVPGVTRKVFGFHNQLEAEEFASCVEFRHQITTTLKVEIVVDAGDPTEVFEGWSF